MIFNTFLLCGPLESCVDEFQCFSAPLLDAQTPGSKRAVAVLIGRAKGRINRAVAGRAFFFQEGREDFAVHFLRDQAPRAGDESYWRNLYSMEVTPDQKLVWTYRDDEKHGIHEFQILDTNGVPLDGRPMK